MVPLSPLDNIDRFSSERGLERCGPHGTLFVRSVFGPATHCPNLWCSPSSQSQQIPTLPQFLLQAAQGQVLSSLPGFTNLWSQEDRDILLAIALGPESDLEAARAWLAAQYESGGGAGLHPPPNTQIDASENPVAGPTLAANGSTVAAQIPPGNQVAHASSAAASQPGHSNHAGNAGTDNFNPASSQAGPSTEAPAAQPRGRVRGLPWTEEELQALDEHIATRSWTTPELPVSSLFHCLLLLICTSCLFIGQTHQVLALTQLTLSPKLEKGPSPSQPHSPCHRVQDLWSHRRPGEGEGGKESQQGLRQWWLQPWRQQPSPQARPW
jgi:hypothetical protein